MKVDKKEIKELIIRFVNMKTKDLKEYLREGEYKGYSKLKKAELLDWVADLVLDDFEYLKNLDEEEEMEREQERLQKEMEERKKQREELERELEENEREYEEGKKQREKEKEERNRVWEEECARREKEREAEMREAEERARKAREEYEQAKEEEKAWEKEREERERSWEEAKAKFASNFEKLFRDMMNGNLSDKNTLIIKVEDENKKLLKKMFKDLSKLYHPDLQKDDKNKEINEEMMKFINSFRDNVKRICE
ncbi:MAG: hypothetical protein ACI3T9_02890 [Romboutsia timonensis]